MNNKNTKDFYATYHPDHRKSYWDTDRFSTYIFVLLEYGEYNWAAEAIREERRFFNANSGREDGETLLHNALTVYDERVDDRIFDFLFHYGADPSIRLSYRNSKGPEEWRTFGEYDGMTAAELAQNKYGYTEENLPHIMGLLLGKKEPRDLYEMGVIDQPLPVQIGPQEFPRSLLRSIKPKMMSLLSGAITLLFSTALATV